MAARKLTTGLEVKDGHVSSQARRRLLFLIDEFTAYGRMPEIERGLAYFAGYGIRCYLICQDISQLESLYKKKEVILSHCGIQIAFTPNSTATAEHLSKICGDQTIIKEQITLNQDNRISLIALDRTQKAYQEVKRPLMTVDEVMHMPTLKERHGQVVASGDMLIYLTGRPMIYGYQMPYFWDDTFVKRASIQFL